MKMNNKEFLIELINKINIIVDDENYIIHTITEDENSLKVDLKYGNKENGNFFCMYVEKNEEIEKFYKYVILDFIRYMLYSEGYTNINEEPRLSFIDEIKNFLKNRMRKALDENK